MYEGLESMIDCLVRPVVNTEQTADILLCIMLPTEIQANHTMRRQFLNVCS